MRIVYFDLRHQKSNLPRLQDETTASAMNEVLLIEGVPILDDRVERFSTAKDKENPSLEQMLRSEGTRDNGTKSSEPRLLSVSWRTRVPSRLLSSSRNHRVVLPTRALNYSPHGLVFGDLALMVIPSSTPVPAA